MADWIMILEITGGILVGLIIIIALVVIFDEFFNRQRKSKEKTLLGETKPKSIRIDDEDVLEFISYQTHIAKNKEEKEEKSKTQGEPLTAGTLGKHTLR